MCTTTDQGNAPDTLAGALRVPCLPVSIYCPYRPMEKKWIWTAIVFPLFVAIAAGVVVKYVEPVSIPRALFEWGLWTVLSPALYLLWSMGRTFWTDYRRHQEKRGSNLGGWGTHLPIEPMPRTPSKPRVEIGKNGRGCLYPQPVTDRRRQRHWKDWLPHALTAATLTVWTIRDALAVWVFVVTSKTSPTLAD